MGLFGPRKRPPVLPDGLTPTERAGIDLIRVRMHELGYDLSGFTDEAIAKTAVIVHRLMRDPDVALAR